MGIDNLKEIMDHYLNYVMRYIHPDYEEAILDYATSENSLTENGKFNEEVLEDFADYLSSVSNYKKEDLEKIILSDFDYEFSHTDEYGEDVDYSEASYSTERLNMVISYDDLKYDVLLTSVYDYNNETNHSLEVNNITLKDNKTNLTNLVEEEVKQNQNKETNSLNLK